MFSKTFDSKVDIYIKNEGYCDVRLHNCLPAMEWCHANGYVNHLAIQFKDEFCGSPVWKPGMKEGMYSFSLTKAQCIKFTRKARAAGLTVESEFE